MNLFGGLQSLTSVLMGLMVLAALVLLWQRDRSVWLIVAIVGEAVGLVFRGALIAAPDLARSMPQLFSIWSFTALVFAVGLLAYAIERTSRK
jgi:uncharacterized MnhB-related membrane protein